MKDITNKIATCCVYNDKFYTLSTRREPRLNDIFLDCKNYSVKIIETEADLITVASMQPEQYIILKEI